MHTMFLFSFNNHEHIAILLSSPVLINLMIFSIMFAVMILHLMIISYELLSDILTLRCPLSWSYIWLSSSTLYCHDSTHTCMPTAIMFVSLCYFHAPLKWLWTSCMTANTLFASVCYCCDSPHLVVAHYYVVSSLLAMALTPLYAFTSICHCYGIRIHICPHMPIDRLIWVLDDKRFYNMCY